MAKCALRSVPWRTQGARGGNNSGMVQVGLSRSARLGRSGGVQLQAAIHDAGSGAVAAARHNGAGARSPTTRGAAPTNVQCRWRGRAGGGAGGQ